MERARLVEFWMWERIPCHSLCFSLLSHPLLLKKTSQNQHTGWHLTKSVVLYKFLSCFQFFHQWHPSCCIAVRFAWINNVKLFEQPTTYRKHLIVSSCITVTMDPGDLSWITHRFSAIVIWNKCLDSSQLFSLYGLGVASRCVRNLKDLWLHCVSEAMWIQSKDTNIFI